MITQVVTITSQEQLMTNNKLTYIYVRGYDCNFIIKVEKDFFLSFEQAEAYILNEFGDTAIVNKVVQKWETDDIILIKNK